MLGLGSFMEKSNSRTGVVCEMILLVVCGRRGDVEGPMDDCRRGVAPICVLIGDLPIGGGRRIFSCIDFLPVKTSNGSGSEPIVRGIVSKDSVLEIGESWILRSRMAPLSWAAYYAQHPCLPKMSSSHCSYV